MDEVVRRIKERVDLVEVVSRYVKLTKAGKNYKGLSPFKKEKTPSFFVSPEKQLYYCFSSGKGGDVFTFIQEMERVDFRGALTILAKEAGIPLRPLSPKEAHQKERWYAALEAAAQWFEEQLLRHLDAYEYLLQRGADATTIARFRLGYAPADPHALLSYLRGKGFSAAELRAVGLAKQREGSNEMMALFRSRIVFPLFDSAGRVIGFSGRRFPDVERLGPKYLNTPETPLFRKGEVLYPWHLAKEAIRRHDCAIVVEGQMDVVNVHRAGWPIAVAVSGTGFTSHHATLLTRAARRVLFALDADDAGFRSLVRSAGMVLSLGAEGGVVELPEGKDPADIVALDPRQWKQLVRGAQPVIHYIARYIKKQRGVPLAQGVQEYLLPVLGAIPSAVQRSFAAQEAAGILGVPVEALLEDVAQWRAREPQGRQEEATQEAAGGHTSSTVADRKRALERFLAAILLYGTDEVRRVVRDILSEGMIRQLEERYAHDEATRFAFEVQEAEEVALASLAKEAAYEVVWLATKEAFAAAAEALKEAEAKEAGEQVVDSLLRELDALRNRLREIEAQWRDLRQRS